MSWSTMHFAVGMGCTGAAATVLCSVVRRGWRWIPVAMTLGGIWANVPDMPRLWREDFPGLPFASTLGSMQLERFLHHWGDIFFFHATMDDQPKAYAMLGFFGVLFFYNLSVALLLVLEHRQRQLRRVPLYVATAQHARTPRPMPHMHAAADPVVRNPVPSEDSVVDELIRQLQTPRPADQIPQAAPAPARRDPAESSRR